MKIQLLSDLHLGFKHKRLPYISEEADVLVMAGDITSSKKRLRKYLRELREDYSMPVVMVLGNHDYYDHYLHKAADGLKGVASKFEDVHVLARDTINFDGVSFVGATLWTDFDNRRDEVSVFISFPDYTKVFKDGDEGQPVCISTLDILDEHHKDRQWLYDNIKNDEKTVVVTHHVPTTACVPDIYRRSPVNGGFYVDMSDLMFTAEPDLWLCGHTHYYFDYQIGKTKIYCNPWGYPFEYNNKGHYREEFLIEI